MRQWDRVEDARAASQDGVELFSQVPETRLHASNLGRIYNTSTGRFIGSVSASGYLVAGGFQVHRAVVAAFDGLRGPEWVVHHINEDKHDNALHNLAYATRSAHMQEHYKVADAEQVVQDVFERKCTREAAARRLGRSVSWIDAKVKKLRTCTVVEHPPLSAAEKAQALEDAARDVESFWRHWPGHPAYEVSNLGRVRNTHDRRVLRPGLDRGYPRVGFVGAVHGAVARIYLPPPTSPAHIVRHWPDPTPTNCRASNLQWGTYAENAQDSITQGLLRRGETHGNAKLTDVSVAEGLRRFMVEEWWVPRLAEFLGISDSAATSLVEGRSWTHVPRPAGFDAAWAARTGRGRHLSTLSADRVRAGLVEFVKHDWTLAQLADFLGVSVPTAYQIVSGKTWKGVERPLGIAARRRKNAGPLNAPNSAVAPALAPTSSGLSVTAALVDRLQRYTSEGWTFATDGTPALTRSEIIEATRADGVASIETQLLPALFQFLRAYVDTHGWFYPRSDETLAAALGAIRGGGPRGGVAYLKARFRSFWDVIGGPSRSFSDDSALNRVLRYRLGLNNSKPYTYTLPSGERVEAQETFDICPREIRNGFIVQRYTTSFFKPVDAFNVYSRWIRDVQSPVVWDPSAGFGARMLGFAAAHPTGTYIANEPAEQTRADLTALAADLRVGGLRVQIDSRGAEFAEFPPNSLDLVFTSPPYFDLEKYYDEPTQCWRKYPTQAAWRDGFLLSLVVAAFAGLKPEAHLVLNVDEARRDDVLHVARLAGFGAPCAEISLALGADHFARKRGIDGKAEPILVFRRPA